MSLLLDALKRSEKARQEKAAQEGGDGPAETREFSLQALEEEAKDPRNQPEPRVGPDDRPRVAETLERPAVAPSFEMEIDERAQRPSTDETVEGFPEFDIVEPTPMDTVDRGVEPYDLRDSEPVGATGEGPTFSLLDDGPADERAVADTGGTMPSGKSLRDSMDSYFDGTSSVSVSMREVRRAMDSEEREDSGEQVVPGHTGTTQRRARTVVEARTAASRARGRSGAWAWLVLLLLVGGLIAGGGYYYYNFVLGGGQSLFAGGQPPPRVTPQPQPQPLPAATAEADVAPVTTAALLPEPVLPEPPVRGDLAPTAEPVTAEPPPTIDLPPPPVEDVLRTPEPAPPASESMQPGDVSQRIAAAIQKAGLPGQASGIRISRAPRKNSVSPTLVRAFDAFQAGDDATAREGWQAVLVRYPGNRDALLGLAALAVRAGQPAQAVELYLRILRERPGDQLAQASLIALSEQLDPVDAESRVKTLLADDGQAPYLHFILGNLYAAQQRWPLAQQAYFDAYRLDKDNPDYVFNLAVSLDHLSQGPAALEYYKRALRMADSRPVGFAPASVMSRIKVMTADATLQ